MLVASVGVENGLEISFIAYLTTIHGTNPVLHWHDLIQIKIWVDLENCLFDSLDLIIKCLNFISTSLVKVLIQKWNIFLFEYLIALFWVLFKKSSDSTWMDDLIARAKSQVQKRGNWNTRHEETLGKCVAYIVDLLNWVCCSIQSFLWTNDPDVLAIIDSLANEWYILQAENS